MDTKTISTTMLGLAVGAGVVFGLQTGATEVKTFDASNARSVEEVRIERSITAPVTTVESFTLNDLASEIEIKDRELARCAQTASARQSLVEKREAFMVEAQAKFDEEQAKRIVEEVTPIEDAI